MAARYVVFSHGKESGPWGTKISAMADVARSEGWQAESVDYRGVDDPQDRVTRLLSFCRDLQGDLVLVGSSLGGYVALAAAALLHARGVFLMAPAIYFDALPPLRPRPLDCPATIVHGWQDEIVPFEHSVRFGREHGVTLHLLNADHRMHGQLRTIQQLFERFIVELDLPEPR